MSEIVHKAESVALSFTDLEKMMGGDPVRLIHYDQLQGESMTSLFSSGKPIIILLQIEGPDAPRVGHWICLLDHGSHYEHFDSYGLTSDEELAFTHENRYLSDMIRKSDKPVEQSTHRLQEMREGVNTCGRWCVARLKNKELELPGFVRFINKIHHQPDVAVTMLTLHLGKKVPVD